MWLCALVYFCFGSDHCTAHPRGFQGAALAMLLFRWCADMFFFCRPKLEIDDEKYRELIRSRAVALLLLLLCVTYYCCCAAAMQSAVTIYHTLYRVLFFVDRRTIVDPGRDL